eukprot:5802058-Prymnesium_polylepis.1
MPRPAVVLSHTTEGIEPLAMTARRPVEARGDRQAESRRCTCIRRAHVGMRKGCCMGNALRNAPEYGWLAATKRTASRTEVPAHRFQCTRHASWWMI